MREQFCVMLFLLGAMASSTSLSQEAVDPKSPLNLPTSAEGLPGAGPLRLYEGFRNLWNARRQAWSKSIDADQQSLVLLGDSITQVWENLDQHFPGVKVTNRGISGDTTRGMLIRLKEDVLALNPRGVVMLMGTNDLAENATPETIVGNIKLIVEALTRSNQKLPIVMCLVFPSSESKQRPAAKIQATNKLLMQAVKGNPQVTVVDTWTLFANEAGDAMADYFPDLLHLNDAGYARWAAGLRPILATLGFLEKEADSFSVEPGFTSLFNGNDLTGWGFRPTNPPQRKANAKPNPDAPVVPVVTNAVSFEAQKATPDGRYVAINGRLVVTTPTEGRRIQQLWTTREFPKNFVLKLDFRASPNADSGVFIRKPQLQCRDFPLAGPYKNLKNYKPQDWNELVIKVEGSKAHATCNGEVLESELAVPETGPIGLEGDRGQMEYRRIRIQEL